MTELDQILDWHGLGRSFGIEESLLNQIKLKNPAVSLQDAKSEVINVFLSTPNCCWKAVVDALHKMKHERVATTIQEKYVGLSGGKHI